MLIIVFSLTGEYMKEVKFIGEFQATKGEFGFVMCKELEQDVFISGKDVNGAFNGDKVEVTLLKRKKGLKPEGYISKILERGTVNLVGTLDLCKGYGFVIPDDSKFNKHIFVSKSNCSYAKNKDKVVVKIINYGTKDSKPEGIITEVIGNIKQPGAAIYCIARSYDLRMDFNAEQLTEALKLNNTLDISNELNYRKDFRNLYTITIDGEDARDLDDAITLEKLEDSYVLGVHIADVTHYVKEYSLLDKEAKKRGTSVYLPDRVIPMLPKDLSNGICSLNQGEDRLTLSCVIKLDMDGNVISSQVVESVINVNKRCSYNEVQDFFDKRIEFDCQLSELLSNALILSNKLKTIRMDRGLVDFDFPESKIILDKRGRAVKILPYERNDTTMLIENFMLMANEVVAETYFWMEVPFLYRVHEAPDEDKLKKLSSLLYGLGYSIKGKTTYSKDFQKILTKFKGRPEEAFVSRFVLRSMKQAKYSTESLGHFGLAVKYYSHFTSPIRRYPDLQIQRIIKESLHGQLSESRIEHYNNILTDVAINSSQTERIANEVERECDKLMKAQLMQRHLGECFDGIISSITGWGMYVELENTVEGMVRLSSMDDDYYIFDEDRMELIGECTNSIFHIGQAVKVIVVGADTTARTVDFELVGEDYEQGEL